MSRWCARKRAFKTGPNSGPPAPSNRCRPGPRPVATHTSIAADASNNVKWRTSTPATSVAPSRPSERRAFWLGVGHRPCAKLSSASREMSCQANARATRGTEPDYLARQRICRPSAIAPPVLMSTTLRSGSGPDTAVHEGAKHEALGDGSDAAVDRVRRRDRRKHCRSVHQRRRRRLDGSASRRVLDHHGCRGPSAASTPRALRAGREILHAIACSCAASRTETPSRYAIPCGLRPKIAA